MENKLFHLSTCSTCKRIIGELEGLLDNVTLQDVKEKLISEEELDYIAEKLGSYEAVFNKRAMKYRSMGLNTQELSEADWKKHILSEYTFMKRPLAVVNGEVFAGNSKKVVEALKTQLNG